MPIHDLFAEAERQLNVCNSCRYCEGYCPVWPTLETMTELSDDKLKHLSNLCHDCRDCFTACMYTAPHEFALNPPKLFSAVRLETYREYAWPPRPGWARGGRGIAALTIVIIVVLLALAALLHGDTSSMRAGSPYRLIPHWVLVGIVSAPVVLGVVVVAIAACRYWRDVHGSLRALARPATWVLALTDGVRLRYMRGGGAECTYPAEEPSGRRRGYHAWLVGGLSLCLVSTIAAGIQEEFLGWQPPYPFFSAPPLTGTLGGAAMIVGSVGLLVDKRDSPAELSAPGVRRGDYLMLATLLVLAVTGLLTLALRSTPLFDAVLVVHLAAVLTCFAVAPYTKFMHFVYRLLSIYKYRLDSYRDRSS
jgi:citrate/tricarballylate utilization protein